MNEFNHFVEKLASVTYWTCLGIQKNSKHKGTPNYSIFELYMSKASDI